ncbi:hypothetical protein SISSUDRAFT_1057777 [Sistotremastrum suecicum HHB10207 ss-3]|uniref:Haemolytic enterotoxin (HBL) n=1 Tax=Sistotremastrum suecicum HHB10207 ss-3 TaxID=1314776 RepID=A0A166I4B1_9AGAM|nr:hypothetical protein SISSUDRAFT_1057777 [Sistotremastrum suecicum HHB10207 ss-3]
MNSELPPPPYSEIIQSAEKFANENPAKFSEAIVKALKDPKTNEALAQQVADLGASVKVIKTNFERVSSTLQLYDGKGHAGNPMKPDWDKLYEEYKVLIAKSKDAARDGKAYADEYLEIVLPLANHATETYEMKIATIDGFIAKVTETATSAESLTKEFKDLETKVNAFQTKLDHNIVETEAKTTEDIVKCKKEIHDLEAEIKKLESMSATAFSFLGVGSGTGALGGGLVCAAGAAGAAAFLLPLGVGLLVVGALVALGAGITAIVAQVKLKSAGNDLAAKKSELLELEAKQRNLEALKSRLENALKDMGEIGVRLGSLSDIWKYIAQDANDVKKHLVKAKGSDATKLVSEAEIEKATALYDALSRVLGNYAAQL